MKVILLLLISLSASSLLGADESPETRAGRIAAMEKIADLALVPPALNMNFPTKCGRSIESVDCTPRSDIHGKASASSA